MRAHDRKLQQDKYRTKDPAKQHQLIREPWKELARIRKEENTTQTPSHPAKSWSRGMEENKEKRLGEVLLDEGLITEQELQKALAIQTDSGGKLGEILISEEFIRAIDFYRVLSETLSIQFGSDSLDYYTDMLDPKLARSFEKETLMKHLFFPIKFEDNTLTVMVVRQDDQEVENLINEKIGFYELKKIIEFDYLN